MLDLIGIVWLLDVLNIIECLDTTYPINTKAWWIIWIVIIICSDSKDK